MSVIDKQAEYYDDPRQKALAQELDKLNAEWLEVTARRKKWMDDHMVDFAKYKIGETIYKFPSGETLGEITKLYRYWGEDHRDPQYDYSMNINYKYHTGRNCYDNTSRQSISICNAEELRKYHKFKAMTYEEIFVREGKNG